MPEEGMLVIKPTCVNYEKPQQFLLWTFALHYLKKGNIQSGQKFLIYELPERSVTSAVQLAQVLGRSNRGMQYTNLELVKSLWSRYSN